jgi:hypothetical protein
VGRRTRQVDPRGAQDIIPRMVRPERRRDVLTGESPVRVSAGAPGSRLQAGAEIRPREAECRKPLKERGASVKLSAERCLGGPSRSCHGEGNRQHSLKPDGMLALSGVLGGGTFAKNIVEQARPSPAAMSGKDRAYKAGRLKVRGAGRESEGFRSTDEGVQHNAPEGRDFRSGNAELKFNQLDNYVFQRLAQWGPTRRTESTADGKVVP